MVEIQYCLLLVAILSTFGVKTDQAEDTQQPLYPKIDSHLGPIKSILENLVYSTASVANEIALQVSSKFERTAEILHGSMELLMANALGQLIPPIFQASFKLNNTNCYTHWTIEELHLRFYAQFQICTSPLNDLMQNYQLNANKSVSAIRSYVSAIVDLPRVCYGAGDNMPKSLTQSTSCVIENISTLNAQISEELDAVRLLLARTKERSEQAAMQLKICTSNLLNGIMKVIDDDLKDC